MMKKLIAVLMAAAMLIAFTACSNGPDVTGKYLAVSATSNGEDATPYLSGEWVELKKGGKGTYYSGFEFDLKWKLDGENFTGTVTFLGLEEELNGTLVDNVLTVTYGDYTYVMVKEGTEAPAAAEGSTAATASEPATYGDVASSITDAFAGAVTAGGSTDFVSPTTEIAFPSLWYGYVRFYDFVGVESDEQIADVWGTFDYYNDRPYFELWEMPLSELTSDDSALLTMYVYEDSEWLMPDITDGDEDAWLIDTYLTSDDVFTYTTQLVNGALDIFATYSGTNGSCSVEFFLREDGAPWDEANDMLPPSYSNYTVTMD